MDFTGSAVCTCGKEMTGGGGQCGGVLNTTYRNCECGLKAVFYSTPADYKVYVGCKHKDDNQRKSEVKDKLLSLFKLSGLKVLESWDIKNGYHGTESDWLLVKTEIGLIKIGWRKRVIEIDWTDTGIKLVVKDDVTKGDYYCHAWSYPNAIEYLTELVNKVDDLL